MIKTTVVILNWNGDKWLEPLLDALRKEECDVLLVDNNSTDYSREFCDIKLNANWGFAQGNNIGASIVETENILFMNNDMLPTKGFLKKMEDRCTEEHQIVGAKLIFGETKQQPVGNGLTLVTKEGLIQHAGVGIHANGLPYEAYRNCESSLPEANIPREVSAVTGACLMIKTKLFVSIKGFDTQFVNGYEDIDLCFRSGAKCWYEPTAEVIHYTSSSVGRFDNEAENQKLFIKKWGKQI